MQKIMSLTAKKYDIFLIQMQKFYYLIGLEIEEISKFQNSVENWKFGQMLQLIYLTAP